MVSQPNQNHFVLPNEESRKLLVHNQLLDEKSLFSWGTPIYQQHEGRCVSLGMLSDPEDSHPRQAFLKTHLGRLRLWPRLNDLRAGQIFQTLPEREWDGIRRLAELGLNVPQRLLLFRKGGFSFRAAILLEKVPPPRSVEQMLKDGTWQQLTAHQQMNLLDTIVLIMQQIHGSGQIWRGTSSRHFYPELQSDQTWKIWLIDCEGVYPQKSQRGFRKNYLKLFRSMKESGANFRLLDQLRRRIEIAQAETTLTSVRQRAA